MRFLASCITPKAFALLMDTPFAEVSAIAQVVEGVFFVITGFCNGLHDG